MSEEESAVPEHVPDSPARRRAAYLAFVREHHPDVGGDPEVFAEGLRRFRETGTDGADRYAAPIAFYRRPRGLSALLAMLRGRRARRRRVR